MNKRILFLLSGSIACYKSCFAISKLVQKGYDVWPVATPSALKFVGAATLEGLTRHSVLSDLYEPGRAMDHIQLARASQIIVLAPATAHTVNRLSQGLSDDVIGALFLANNFRVPFLIAPAMNTEMFNHPATQASMNVLKSWGTHLLVAPEGPLACGEYGQGRMIEPEDLVREIEARV